MQLQRKAPETPRMARNRECETHARGNQRNKLHSKGAGEIQGSSP